MFSYHEKTDPFTPLIQAKALSETQQYYGVFVAKSDDFTQSFSIDKVAEYSRVTSLEGELFQFVFDDSDERQVFEEHQGALIYPFEYNALLWQSIPLTCEKFSKKHQAESSPYTLLDLGPRRVADRVVNEYFLEANTDDRYSLVLYLEPETGLLLKKAWYWQSKEIASATMSALSPTPITPFRDKSEALVLRDSSSTNSAKLVKSSPWMNSLHLPPGFELVSLQDTEAQSHACYSDGICELSAFFTQVNKSEPYALQENQSGSFSGITQSVTLTKNNYQLTLCGHIPLETLQQVMLNLH